MMLSKIIRQGVAINSRCFATATVQDPIQKLFLEKIQEYKKKANADGLIESDAKSNAMLADELDRIRNQFGVKKGEEDKITTKISDTFKMDDPIKIQYD